MTVDADVEPVARCLGCGALMDEDEELFDGKAVVPAGRWIMWNGNLSHMCHGYAAEPAMAVGMDVWAASKGAAA